MSDKKDKGYRDTLNQPNTSFPMKANLVQHELHRGPRNRRLSDA